ncbi:MAG: HepT-like ribonuclease domain-containing protein [Planctomycetota bacterium]
MNVEAKKLLLDILQSCVAIREYCAGKVFPDYSRDRMLRSATERELQIVGEASVRLRRMAPEIADSFPQAERIIAFRNRLVHGYDVLDDAVVWGIVERHLPALETAARERLENAGGMVS